MLVLPAVALEPPAVTLEPPAVALEPPTVALEPPVEPPLAPPPLSVLPLAPVLAFLPPPDSAALPAAPLGFPNVRSEDEQPKLVAVREIKHARASVRIWRERTLANGSALALERWKSSELSAVHCRIAVCGYSAQKSVLSEPLRLIGSSLRVRKLTSAPAKAL